MGVRQRLEKIEDRLLPPREKPVLHVHLADMSCEQCNAMTPAARQEYEADTVTLTVNLAGNPEDLLPESRPQSPPTTAQDAPD